jgi:hypothetical protein
MRKGEFMRSLIPAVAAAALLAAGAAGAHHSFAMFDPNKVVVLDGAVKEFAWTNPHVNIRLMVKPTGGGDPQLWTIELTSPGNLTRAGWTRTTLKPGDQAEVTIHPLRSGEHGGGFLKLKTASGQVFVGGSPGPVQGVS